MLVSLPIYYIHYVKSSLVVGGCLVALLYILSPFADKVVAVVANPTRYSGSGTTQSTGDVGTDLQVSPTRAGFQTCPYA